MEDNHSILDLLWKTTGVFNSTSQKVRKLEFQAQQIFSRTLQSTGISTTAVAITEVNDLISMLQNPIPALLDLRLTTSHTNTLEQLADLFNNNTKICQQYASTPSQLIILHNPKLFLIIIKNGLWINQILLFVTLMRLIIRQVLTRLIIQYAQPHIAVQPKKSNKPTVIPISQPE